MISLRIPTLDDEQVIKDYVDTFQENGELIEGNVGMLQYMTFYEWHRAYSDSRSDRTHLILHNGTMVGTIDFRFSKTPRQTKTLGMIGYAITPNHRGQGFATMALTKAVQSYPAKKIIITCLKENIASSKVIENAGGVLIKEFFFDGKPSLRYLLSKE